MVLIVILHAGPRTSLARISDFTTASDADASVSHVYTVREGRVDLPHSHTGSGEEKNSALCRKECIHEGYTCSYLPSENILVSPVTMD